MEIYPELYDALTAEASNRFYISFFPISNPKYACAHLL